MKKRFFVTTPIFYINDKPHIGHTYSVVAADILARYQRMMGMEVFFLTGTDENSQKTVEAAAKLGKNVTEYTDEMSAIWKQTWKDLGISNDDFIRTSEKRHIDGITKFWKVVRDANTDHGPNISLGKYIGLYCTGCEAYLKESDLVDGMCPHHKKPPEYLEEENYFFALDAYRDQLLELLDRGDFVLPQKRLKEVRNFVENHLDPLSISRESKGWGVSVPGNDKHVIYVWFDALLNYMTAIGYGWNDDLFSKWWSKDTEIVHIVGKDITKFHCAIWPAMLMAGGERLPNKVPAHGFYTIDGEKISKSLGNAIDPRELTNEYGFDAIRYFVFREIPFGEDGDFRFERLRDRYQSDLANDFGNLVNRVLVMTHKYCDGKFPMREKSTLKIEEKASEVWKQIAKGMNSYAFHDVLDSIWTLVLHLNKSIELSKPWAKAKAGDQSLFSDIADMLEGVLHLAVMLLPFMPTKMKELLLAFGVEDDISLNQAGLSWGILEEGDEIQMISPLFPKKEA